MAVPLAALSLAGAQATSLSSAPTLLSANTHSAGASQAHLAAVQARTTTQVGQAGERRALEVADRMHLGTYGAFGDKVELGAGNVPDWTARWPFPDAEERQAQGGREPQAPGAGRHPLVRQHPAVRSLSLPGSIAAFGDAPFFGAPGPDARGLTGIAVLPSGAGYWAVDKAGDVFAYGQAPYLGSLRGRRPVGGVATIVATTKGSGYWVVSRAGGVYCFGDATFYGSLGKTDLKAPVVGMAVATGGKGYWLVTSAGGVYSFGSAVFAGSLGSTHLPAPIVGIAAAKDGQGYWLASADGGVYSFGTARYLGSLSGRASVRAIASDRSGKGYWLLATDGHVHGFGTRTFGSPTTKGDVEAAAMAPTINGRGYFLGAVGWARRSGPAGVISQRHYLGDFMVTCYDLTGPTASGAMAGPQSVAVDPNVIPLGAQLYIDGVGERTADDTGGAILGDHVDIWEPTYYQCANWGVQDRSVYELGGS